MSGKVVVGEWRRKPWWMIGYPKWRRRVVWYDAGKVTLKEWQYVEAPPW